jgi:hypothetical protein
MLLDELLDVAEKENVHISYDGLSRPGVQLHGLYFVEGERQQGMIILDTALKNDPLKHAVVLAEELGHHFAGVNTCFVTSSAEAILQDEVNALRAALQVITRITCGIPLTEG